MDFAGILGTDSPEFREADAFALAFSLLVCFLIFGQPVALGGSLITFLNAAPVLGIVLIPASILLLVPFAVTFWFSATDDEPGAEYTSLMVGTSLLLLALATLDASIYWLGSMEWGTPVSWAIGLFLVIGMVKSVNIARSFRYVFRNCTKIELVATAAAVIIFSLALWFLGQPQLSVAFVIVSEMSMICTKAFAPPKKLHGL
ncbi:MAG: hypothetical protein AB1324_01115 [Candidatus Micrarchaeota archaeon]